MLDLSGCLAGREVQRGEGRREGELRKEILKKRKERGRER